jgi:hypothetical protein
MAAVRSGWIRCLWAWAVLTLMPVSVWAASWQILVVGLRDDPRYERKTLEQAFIGKPTGRPLVAAQIALDELKDNLQDSGNQLKLQDLQWDGKNTTELLAEINKRKAQVLLLDLPAEQQKALMEVFGKITTAPIVFNISDSSDALRGASCHPHWLHTLPSDRMLADAMAQWLAARNWRDMILLVGAQPQDGADVEAAVTDFKRRGLEARAAAGLARRDHVGQKRHLAAQNALPFARRTASTAGGVKREALRRKAAHFRLGQVGIKAPNIVPDSQKCRRHRARRATDRRLIDSQRALHIIGADQTAVR